MCVLSSGVPVSSRVSAKIQQLVNTLKQPRRPPLREFFVDDFEELLEGEFMVFSDLLNLQHASCTVSDMFWLIRPSKYSLILSRLIKLRPLNIEEL